MINWRLLSAIFSALIKCTTQQFLILLRDCDVEFAYARLDQVELAGEIVDFCGNNREFCCNVVEALGCLRVRPDFQEGTTRAEKTLATVGYRALRNVLIHRCSEAEIAEMEARLGINNGGSEPAARADAIIDASRRHPFDHLMVICTVAEFGYDPQDGGMTDEQVRLSRGH